MREGPEGGGRDGGGGGAWQQSGKGTKSVHCDGACQAHRGALMMPSANRQLPTATVFISAVPADYCNSRP